MVKFKRQPGCKSGGSCCVQCKLYLFDNSTTVNSSDWTVDTGSVTFNANTIELGPGAKITLNAVALDTNNYSAEVSVSSENASDDLQLHLDDASVRIEYSSGDYTLTLNNGESDKSRERGGATRENPALRLCVTPLDKVFGSSGWTTDGGYGYLGDDYEGSLGGGYGAGSLSIENHGSNTVTLSGIDLSWFSVDDTTCKNCTPESDACGNCNEGWLPSRVDFTFGNRFNPLGPISDYSVGFPIDESTAGGSCHYGIVDGTTLWSDQPPGETYPQERSVLMSIQEYYGAFDEIPAIKIRVRDEYTDETTHNITEHFLVYDRGFDGCFDNFSLTLADFTLVSSTAIEGTEMEIYDATLAVSVDVEVTQ